jgi:hypothetical protein
MLTYAHVCSRMLTYAGGAAGVCQEEGVLDVCSRMLTYAHVCWGCSGSVPRRRKRRSAGSPARSLPRYSLNAVVIYYYCILLLTSRREPRALAAQVLSECSSNILLRKRRSAVSPARSLRSFSPSAPPAYVSIRQHTSAYVSIRQHTLSPARSLRRYSLNAEVICYYCILLLTLRREPRALAAQVRFECSSNIYY